MINLKTLPNATQQQVFDQVVTHMRKQGRKSLLENGNGVGGTCRYLTPDGLRCAAGCLIAANEYVRAMDEGIEGVFSSTTWVDLIKQKLVPDTHSELIIQLQQVHDSYDLDKWETGFINVAERFGLVVPTTA